MSTRILIKAGSRVLCKEHDQPDIPAIEHIVRQIAILTQNGYEIVFVTSGAVMAGLFSLTQKENFCHERLKEAGKRALAAHGQTQLMGIYQDLFEYYKLNICQVLMKKHDFNLPTLPEIQNIFNAIWESSLIPIVNENDVTACSTDKFTDNDELASMLSCILPVHRAILLTSVDGLFTGNPMHSHNTLIKEVTRAQPHLLNGIDSTVGSGRGGMQSKIMNALRISDAGIPVNIANGRKQNVITDIILNGRQEGTFFPPAIIS